MSNAFQLPSFISNKFFQTVFAGLLLMLMSGAGVVIGDYLSHKFVTEQEFSEYQESIKLEYVPASKINQIEANFKEWTAVQKEISKKMDKLINDNLLLNSTLEFIIKEVERNRTDTKEDFGELKKNLNTLEQRVYEIEKN